MKYPGFGSILIAASALLAAPMAFAGGAPGQNQDGQGLNGQGLDGKGLNGRGLDGKGLDGLEMDVVSEHAKPNDASSKTLALPDEASDTAREHAQAGLDKANAAREDGTAFGESTAEAATGGTHGKPADLPGGRP